MQNPRLPPAPNPFRSATFLLSCASMAQFPRDDLPELAFAGRSNAGKSSAMNVLCDQRQLARVSKTPGRTQLINLFGLGDWGRLADLPGYGYANAPRNVVQDWSHLISSYIEARNNLKALVVIMDIRHPLTDYDEQMLAWSQARLMPCHILLTKADKLGYGAAKSTLIKVQKAVAGNPAPTTAQLFSSTARTGVEEARQQLFGLMQLQAQ